MNQGVDDELVEVVATVGELFEDLVALGDGVEEEGVKDFQGCRVGAVVASELVVEALAEAFGDRARRVEVFEHVWIDFHTVKKGITESRDCSVVEADSAVSHSVVRVHVVQIEVEDQVYLVVHELRRL